MLALNSHDEFRLTHLFGFFCSVKNPMAELEATKKASIMFINRTALFVQEEKYTASIRRHYLVPSFSDRSCHC